MPCNYISIWNMFQKCENSTWAMFALDRFNHDTDLWSRIAAFVHDAISVFSRRNIEGGCSSRCWILMSWYDVEASGDIQLKDTYLCCPRNPDTSCEGKPHLVDGWQSQRPWKCLPSRSLLQVCLDSTVQCVQRGEMYYAVICKVKCEHLCVAVSFLFTMESS